MFKNVRFLRLAGAWPDTESDLDEALARAAFRPCGPLTEKSAGWEAPVEAGDDALGRRVAGADLLQLRSQSRILPAAAINEALVERIEEFRERMGEAPRPREKRRLKLETRDNLLPKALLRSERTRGFFLRDESILAIDALASPKVERFLEALRIPLGRFEAQPLAFRRPVAELLTRSFMGDAPPGVVVGRECRMQDPSDSRATVRWVDMDLADAAIRQHVRDGMKVTHLAIEFESVMTCVLDENGGLGKLKLVGMDANEVQEESDALTRFDAEFVLLTGTLRRFLTVIAKALGGYADAVAPTR